MPSTRTISLTVLAMLAFAGNSILGRLALKTTQIDAASFTSIRLASGALMLWLILHGSRGKSSIRGNWASALALFAYASTFSFAYITLPTGTGALLLFGAVQVTMIAWGMWHGERFSPLQLFGFSGAIGGLILLLLPGINAPSLQGAFLMIIAGIAWGIYSLRGKGARDPLGVTSGNFLRTVPITILLSIAMFAHASIDLRGALFAVMSGALTSGIGYSIWYAALPGLKSTHAATVQLSVPVIASLGGVLLLNELLTLRLIFASIAILGGILLVLRK